MLQLVPGVTVPPAKLASSTAVRRLQMDYAKLMQDPVDGMLALLNEDNILEWHCCLRGSPVITTITQNGRSTLQMYDRPGQPTQFQRKVEKAGGLIRFERFA
ncbi:hypothetical protein CAEBREN_01571 [Caenorhabditis brenneri]|uniref:UBC core domain-containing protein n=1 Tax=Caenorhabditis brenneri TaxID=135651 RepID=G0P3T0_CAEBE|nr:hypothetical protein CAEBREN_01571 [Caenorhabditis brenneri]